MTKKGIELCAGNKMLISVGHEFVYSFSIIDRLLADGWSWSSAEAKWSILHETHLRSGPPILGSVL